MKLGTGSCGCGWPGAAAAAVRAGAQGLPKNGLSGTSNPASYESDVTVHGGGQGAPPSRAPSA